MIKPDVRFRAEEFAPGVAWCTSAPVTHVARNPSSRLLLVPKPVVDGVRQLDPEGEPEHEHRNDQRKQKCD
jgi:hypothetical protein